MSAKPAEDFSKVLKVRSLVHEDKLNLIFEDCWNGLHKLKRSKTEQLSVVLKRIQLTMLKVQRKRSREEVSASVGVPIEACLYDPAGNPVPGDRPNEEAWIEDGRLMIGSHFYTVQVNPPSILSLKLSDCLLSGCPVVPKV